MRGASAYAPGHLTGLFQICDQPEDPLRKGARGAGFSITRGMRTDVHVTDSQRFSLSISINGVSTRDAVVSRKVVSKMISGLDRPVRIVVEHTSLIPIGAGFGASGAGALSLALALNEALDLGLSRLEAARVAHIAEIECKTGLGSVLAELTGGFGLTLKPGGPGVGETVKFKDVEGLRAVILHFGPISTKEALSNEAIRRRINELGGRFVDELAASQDHKLFMELSRRFAEHVGLITPRIRAVLDRTDRAGFVCTMAMFGETVFSLVEEDYVEELLPLIKEAAPGRDVFVDMIDFRGARLLDDGEPKSG